VELGVCDAIEEAPINRFVLEPEVKPAPVSPKVAQSKPAPTPAPKAVVLLGNASCVSALSQTGVQRLRESDHMLEAGAHRCAAFPIYSPARLMNLPLLKREAWADLLKLKASLGDAR
jgi:hypothetical protein